MVFDERRDKKPDSTANRREDNVDLAYIILWLKQAEADAVEASQSNNSTHALYWVQQSVEKSVKGLMLYRGKSYSAVRVIRHHSLKGYRSLILSIFDEPAVTPFIDGVLDAHSRKSLGKLEEFLRDDKAYSKTRRWSPARINQLLQITSTFKRIRKRKLGELERHVNPPGSLTSYIEALPKVSVGNSELTESLLAANNLCQHRLTEADAAVNVSVRNYLRGEVESRFEVAEAGLSLYILACITFSHTDSLRYPARPGAPQDLSKAMNCKKRDSFGVQHYSNNIGAIHHVKKLALEAEAVAKTFQTALPKMSEVKPLPPCEVCIREACCAVERNCGDH